MVVTEITIPRAYALVIVNVVLNWVVLMWQALQVGKARNKYGVKYPDLYHPKRSEEATKFNCVQRAHQNSLEWNPGFLAFLLIGGISCPYVAAASGLVYNAGRVAHAKKYYEGNAHGGLWGLYGIFVLMGCTGITAWRLAFQ